HTNKQTIDKLGQNSSSELTYNNDVVLTENNIQNYSGLDKNYVHDQGTPQSKWIINHPLNKKVSPIVTDSAGTVVEGKITINNGNQVVIEFNFPFSGEAILN